MSVEEIQKYLQERTALSSTAAAVAAPSSNVTAQPELNVAPAAPVIMPSSVTRVVQIPNVVPQLSNVPVSTPTVAVTPAPTALRREQRNPVSQQVGRPQTGPRAANPSISGRQPSTAAAAPVRRMGRPQEPTANTPDPALAATIAWIEGAPGSSQPTVPIARRASRAPNVSAVRGYTRTVPNQLVRLGTNAPILPVSQEPAPESVPEVRCLFNEWQMAHTQQIGARQVELQLKIAKFLEQDFSIQLPVVAGQITYPQAMTAWSVLSAALFAVDTKVQFELLIPVLQDRVKAVHEQCLVKWHRNIQEIRKYLSYRVHPSTLPDFLEDKDKTLINRLAKQNQPIQTWLAELIAARNSHREAQRLALANPMVQQQPIQFNSGRTVTFGGGSKKATSRDTARAGKPADPV